MTSIEFLASLSPIAQRMMSIFQFKEERPIDLHITDSKEKPCYMIFNNPDCYPVYINPDALGLKAEKAFMHQFCHCVQMESKFPYVRSKDPNDKEAAELAAAITSLVLDMYVNHALADNGYIDETKEKQDLYNELHFRFRYFIENKVNITEKKKYAEYIYAAEIAKVYLDHESKLARDLQRQIASYSPTIKSYSGIFINTVKSYAYDTNMGCHFIFDHLLERLKLNDILVMEHRKEFDTEEEKAASEEEQKVKAETATTDEKEAE